MISDGQTAAGEVLVAKTISSPAQRWVNGINTALLELAANTNRNARADHLRNDPW